MSIEIIMPNFVLILLIINTITKELLFAICFLKFLFRKSRKKIIGHVSNNFSTIYILLNY